MLLVTNFIKDYSVEIIIGLAALGLILLIYSIVLSVKMSGITRRRSTQLESGQVGDIVNYITDQSDTLSVIQEKLAAIAAKQEDQGHILESCVQKVGLVKFNAFDDVGGDQSFALALLDSKNNGVIISSLYGRQDSRTYIKGITNSTGERALSDEEQRALKAALG